MTEYNKEFELAKFLKLNVTEFSSLSEHNIYDQIMSGNIDTSNYSKYVKLVNMLNPDNVSRMFNNSIIPIKDVKIESMGIQKAIDVLVKAGYPIQPIDFSTLKKVEDLKKHCVDFVPEWGYSRPIHKLNARVNYNKKSAYSASEMEIMKVKKLSTVEKKTTDEQLITSWKLLRGLI